jgi:hypothetical protein
MVAVNIRVQKHREALRQAGLRPVQIWVPDTRPTEFALECERQVRILAAADQLDVQALDALMHESLADVEGWTA